MFILLNYQYLKYNSLLIELVGKLEIHSTISIFGKGNQKKRQTTFGYLTYRDECALGKVEDLFQIVCCFMFFVVPQRFTEKHEGSQRNCITF